MARQRAFEWFLRGAVPVLEREVGRERADAVAARAREEHERLLPEIPDIGGFRNVFQPIMSANGWLVALHRAMRAEGKQAADTIRVAQRVFDGWFRKLPGPVLRGLGRALLSPPARAFFEAQARRSQERRFAEDFVWRVERGPQGEIAMVFDECAVNKWYEAQDERDLAPYCNFVDVTYSRLMGMGLDASETIGLGCERCALRFRHGRPTEVPKSLGGIVPDG